MYIINDKGRQPLKMYYLVMVEVNFNYIQTTIIFNIRLVKICNAVSQNKQKSNLQEILN